MRFLQALALVCGLVAHAAAGPYFISPTPSTTTGTAYQGIAGQFYFAASSANISTTTALVPTKSTWTITLNGATGGVRATSFTGSGAGLTGVIASSFTGTTNASMIGDGTPGSPYGVKASSVAILNASGLVPNSLLDSSSVTKQGIGLSSSCASGQYFQQQITVGGLVKGGNCVSAGIGDAVLASTQTWSGTNTYLQPVIISSAILASTPTANTMYADNVPKGWLVFVATGTIQVQQGFNISSIIDNGVGDYFVNFLRPCQVAPMLTMCGFERGGDAAGVCNVPQGATYSGTGVAVNYFDQAGVSRDPNKIFVLLFCRQ